MTLLQKTCALLPATPLLLVYALLEAPVPISNVYCCISNDQPNALRPLSSAPCIFFAPPTGRSPSAPFAEGRRSSSVFRISEMAYGCGITIFYRSWLISLRKFKASVKSTVWAASWASFAQRAWINWLSYYVSKWHEERNKLVTNYSHLDTIINVQFIFP